MRGNNEHQETNGTLDKLKWLLVLVVFIAIIWGNAYFSEPNNIYQASFIVKIIAIIGLSAVALLLAATTNKGKKVLFFVKEARFELRKVVWATRRETIQTTALIVVITMISSLFLWGLDSITIRLVSFLTLLGH